MLINLGCLCDCLLYLHCASYVLIAFVWCLLAAPSCWSYATPEYLTSEFRLCQRLRLQFYSSNKCHCGSSASDVDEPSV